MGYYTDYTLTVENADDKLEELTEMLTKEYGFEAWGEQFWRNAKWYEHDNDMLELSREYPEVLFDLYGDGEDSDDMWHSYYKNGKMQHCPAEITFPPFDEAKLE